MTDVQAGIDAGKREHHCVVIDETGTVLLSKRIENDEDTLLALMSDISDLAADGSVTWATDLNAGGAVLLPNEQLSQDLRLMISHRTDLTHDRVRTINRLRAILLEYFPALETAFDYSKSKAALILLQGYQTPKALRTIGETRLTKWLQARGARNSAAVAARAVTAAKAQTAVTPAQSYGQTRVASLASDLVRIDAELAALERKITQVLISHKDATTLLNVPGFGPILAADFIANTGGNMSAFQTADRLASVAGLAPTPRDSGRISGTSIGLNDTTGGCCAPAALQPRRA